MFYRYRMSDARPWQGLSIVMPSLPEGIQFGAYTNEYKNQLEEIPIGSEQLNCKVYKAPLMPQWHIDIGLTFKGLKALPDFFSRGPTFYVSERVKILLQQVESFDHQFWPVNLFDGKKEITEKTYYRLFVRRKVRIQDLDLPFDDVNFESMDHIDFSMTKIEKDVLPTVQRTKGLRDMLETFPLWQHINQDDLLYINKTLFDYFKNEGVTGLAEYTARGGKRKETLGHV